MRLDIPEPTRLIQLLQPPAIMHLQKVFLLCLLIPGSASAATSQITFWAYDQHAGGSPYYSHYQVTTADYEDSVGTVDLYDSGWGNMYPGNSAFHYMASIEALYANTGISRSIGWHEYGMEWDDSTMTISLSVDGNTLRTGTYTGIPAFFRFVFNGSGGVGQETVIDDFRYSINGTLIYQQGFESGTLGAGWTVIRQDSGTHVSSGDTSTVHEGSGSLALGVSSPGGDAAIVVLDLASVPEPSVAVLGMLGLGLVARRRRC
jgi:hypothetical protein